MKNFISLLLSLFAKKEPVKPITMPVPKTAEVAIGGTWKFMFERPIDGDKFADKAAINDHYSTFSTAMPRERRLTFCSAYGCRTQKGMTISADTLLGLRALYENKVRDGVSERAFFAEAIAVLEKATSEAAGVKDDRVSIDFSGAGDPGQLDCVDEATNSTSFLLILGTYGMVRFHRIRKPLWKGGVLRWTHYMAIVVDTKTGVDYAIDSGVTKTGGKPLIVEEATFYV